MISIIYVVLLSGTLKTLAMSQPKSWTKSKQFTHPVCKILHTPSHSTVCSAPRPDRGYRRQHTSERSVGKETGDKVVNFLYITWRILEYTTPWVYLQHKVPVWSQLKVQVLVVQMFSEGQQELVLPADVCGQDQRAQLLFHVLPAEQKNTNVLLSDCTWMTNTLCLYW